MGEKENINTGDWTDELRDLAPVDDIEDFDTYEEMLNWAFQNKRVKNIALSGPYGSGKSSIIETYLKKYKEASKSALRVSMATFTCETKAQENNRNSGDNPNQEDKSGFNEDEIEKAILKQLFYKVNPKRIPQSTYRRVSIRNRIETYAVVFFTLLFAGIGVGIVLPNIGNNFFGILDLIRDKLDLKIPGLKVIGFLLFVIVVAAFIEIVYGTELFNMRLKGVKLLSNTTIKSKSGKSDSVFNRNLDEIMYFFEKTGYNLVFFEDIDRLDNTKIFIHLHELCYLLNNDDVIKNKPIRFVYAIKEDFFNAESKTKFFDFIIPVIPVVNASNSCEKLIENIRKARKKGIEHNISREFARGIGWYISDMRMLLNVYNEFLAYKQALKVQADHGLSDEKMFAMMAFKSMCPREFADVQAEKGALKQAFVEKEIFISKKVKEIDSKIREMRVRRGYRERSLLNSESREMESKNRSDYFNYYNELKTRLSQKTLGRLIKEYGEHALLSENICENKFLIFLLKNEYIEEGYRDYINYFYAETMEGEHVGEAERTFILHTRQQKQLEFDYKIENPAVVIDHFDADYFGKQVIRNFDVLRELIKGEHTEKLRRMIRMLSEKPSENWRFIEEFRCRESNEISEEFVRILLIEWKGIWDYIAENRRIIANDIKDTNNSRYSTLRQVSSIRVSYGNSGLKVLTPLFGSRLYYFRKIILGENISILDRRDKGLKKYLEYDARILQKLEIDISGDKKELIQFDMALYILQIEFKELDLEGVSDEVARRVLMGRYYSINPRTIQSIMFYLSKGSITRDNFKYKPYSTIINFWNRVRTDEYEVSEETKEEIADFLSYIHLRIEDFVRDFVLLRKELKDNEEDIFEMVKMLEKYPGIQKKLIQREGFTLDDIGRWNPETVKVNSNIKDRDCSSFIWDTLLQNDRIVVNWENVIVYYQTFGSTDIVKDYIVRHSEELRRDMIGKDVQPSIIELLYAGTYAFEAPVD